MTNEEKLGSAPLFRLMMSMGIPTLVAQIINLLYNIIDRIYIGHIPEVGEIGWKREERRGGTDPGKWIFPSSYFFCLPHGSVFCY